MRMRIHAVHADDAHICRSMCIDAHVKILMRINHIHTLNPVVHFNENTNMYLSIQRQKKTTIPHLISPSIYAIMHVLELDLAVESTSHQYE